MAEGGRFTDRRACWEQEPLAKDDPPPLLSAVCERRRIEGKKNVFPMVGWSMPSIDGVMTARVTGGTADDKFSGGV